MSDESVLRMRVEQPEAENALLNEAIKAQGAQIVSLVKTRNQFREALKLASKTLTDVRNGGNAWLIDPALAVIQEALK